MDSFTDLVTEQGLWATASVDDRPAGTDRARASSALGRSATPADVLVGQTVRKAAGPVRSGGDLRDSITAESFPQTAGTLDARIRGASALVCFSHLRWNFVWQRPQHLLSRIARHLPVYVVEEPEFAEDDAPASVRMERRGDVTVITPLLPFDPEPRWGFNDTTNPQIRNLLAPVFSDLGLLGEESGTLVAWYYTPMAWGVAPHAFRPALVVFDAMDELANFRGAPRRLREQEAALMAEADLVFTGGPSLYEARKDRHPDVHCFPSGVEASHFAQAANGVARPADLAAVTRPVIGFYGVIDERVDLELLGAIAAARPDWTLAMIGPVLKIAKEDLPQHPNILYFGKQEYRDLPGFLACFDVAILPFARNEATQFISPTKTLEYMAGEKPIVSTPIKDVVDLYGEVVAIAESPEEFVAAIERALAEGPADRIRRLARARALLTLHDWDVIAARMATLMGDALASRAPAFAMTAPRTTSVVAAGFPPEPAFRSIRGTLPLAGVRDDARALLDRSVTDAADD